MHHERSTDSGVLWHIVDNEDTFLRTTGVAFICIPKANVEIRTAIVNECAFPSSNFVLTNCYSNTVEEDSFDQHSGILDDMSVLCSRDFALNNINQVAMQQ